MTNGIPSGSIAAVLTPITAHGSIDSDALHGLVRSIIHGGVSGLLVLGSSGEVASLSRAQRRTVIDTAIVSAAGEVPVMVGVANAP